MWVRVRGVGVKRVSGAERVRERPNMSSGRMKVLRSEAVKR